ncbi:undecaprenyl-phosphate glucose phosphotransferase [Ralstonia sp. ASV6]|uniref:undecaprenyl-phosphate glucose phosphotransferase n=1 Tax=Ralstonia sp. ASV6 TaxID=2795124 RepID=UPI0018ECBDB9|nr:undecaprenyl-phosphate glucose phosphotransferase [Ralstonia sp. ASV6]
MVFGAVVAHEMQLGGPIDWSRTEILASVLAGCLVLAGLAISGVYGKRFQSRPLRSIPRFLIVWLLTHGLIVHLFLAAHMPVLVLTPWVAAWTLASIASMLASRVCSEMFWRIKGRVHVVIRRVVIVGGAEQTQRLMERVQNDAYIVVGQLDPNNAAEQADAAVHRLASMQDVIEWAADQQFDELWLALPPSQEEEIQRYLRAMQHHFVDVRLFPVTSDLPLFNPDASMLGGMPVINLVASSRDVSLAWAKPVFDRLFALAALVGLLPLLVAIALLVKGTSAGPVFFRQRRMGADGREFTILKFRSMRVHVEEAGTLTQARQGDPRVTPIGRLLRKSSLDELPQFINVLLGQMSVVGPRPHALEHDDYYMRLVDGYMYRYRIKPGITGLAQVNGCRGETARIESMAKRVSLDLFYIQNWSFWLDLKIVWMTVFKGFSGRNAY